MVKRFRNPDDRPQLIVPELREMARDVLAILPYLPYDPTPHPDFPWAILLRRFAKSFTPDQLDAMKSGKHLLLVDLTPEQRDTVLQAVLLRAYGDSRTYWEQLFHQLDGLPASMIRLDKQGVFHPTAGKDAVYYDVVHVAADHHGNTEAVSLGQFRKEVTP